MPRTTCLGSAQSRSVLLRRAALSLLMLGIASPVSAQRCPANEEVDPWLSIDSGDQGPGSTYASDAGSVSLCSATDGFGETTDLVRYAYQLRDHDFALQALVMNVDPGGSGGLIAISPFGASSHAARIAVEVYVTPSGEALLRSSIRRNTDGTVDPAVSDIPVTLPVHLEIVREGNEVRTAIVGGPTHLSATLDPQGDLKGPMRVGLAQTSNEAGVARTASFYRVSLSAPEAGAEIACVEPEATFAGQPIQIRGVHLDRIDGVRIGGVPVSFDAASSTRLVASAPGAEGSWRQAPFEISQGGRFREVATTSFVGTPIRRGDVNEDGEVTTEDYRQLCYHVYRRAVLECSAAGDVDADGDRDEDDVARLARFLSTGRDAPEAPFEEPAFVEGTIACGQPEGPEIYAIERADGSALDGPIREGDDIVIIGENLPSPERAVVRFGPNETIPDASSSPSRLGLRIGPVLEGGNQCPRILDAAPGAPGDARFGPAFGIESSETLCVDFEASRLSGQLRAEIVRDRLQIHVPADSLRPGNRLHVSFALYLPYVVGQTRGPRAASFDFIVPNLPYGRALAELAKRIGKAANDSSSDECGCELAVTHVPASGLVILPPCHLLPEEPPTPAIPGLPGQVKPTTQIWSELGIYNNLPGPGCDAEIDPDVEPRRFFWCQLEELSEIQGLDAHPLHQGLPLWESYEGTLWNLPNDPRDRSTQEKSILTSHYIHNIVDSYYGSPCEMALRSVKCGNASLPWWMPWFPKGERVLKTFWQPLENLPSSVDENTLYSYDPPDQPRQYLVGMHIGWSIGLAEGLDDPPDYFLWSTFWLEADNDTHTKGGAPLSTVYSPHCTTGHGADKPASLVGSTFGGFAMCTDWRAGEQACGNPWAPGECPDQGSTSCTGCHIQSGRLSFAGHGTSLDPEIVRIGWFATITSHSSSNATACMATIESDPDFFGPNWVPPIPSQPAENCFDGLFF